MNLKWRVRGLVRESEGDGGLRGGVSGFGN
jgi:hypothetical protein